MKEENCALKGSRLQMTDNVINFINHYIIFRFSRPLLTVAATFTIIIMITGILGNLLTIVALIRSPKIRNVAADFIIR
jgi:hypothetical protein